MVRYCFITVIMILLLSFSGCTEEQLQKADSIAQGVNDVSTAIETVAPTLPPPISVYAGLGALIASLFANGWQSYRKKQLQLTAKSIVQGVENSGAMAVKAEIEKAMKVNGVALIGKQIVTELKH